MAGIGFELKKVIYEGGYLSATKAYVYGATISSGPWLISILTLTLLTVSARAWLPLEAQDLFAATVTHTFAVSLITTGAIQMFVTRYLAGQHYLDELEPLAPTFIAVLVLSSGAQFVIMSVLLAFTTLPLDYRLAALALYVAVSGTWIAMVFLSAAKQYVAIVVAFGLGYTLSFVAAVFLGTRFGIGAYLAGFAAGQVLTLALLSARVLAEFALERSFSVTVFSYGKRYPSLVAIGFLFNLGFWIDKLLFWFSPEGMDVGSFWGVFPIYDTLFFVASLTIVPAVAIFIVNVETDFYNHYKGFYTAIDEKRSLWELDAARQGMRRSLTFSYLVLAKVQIAIVLLVGFLFAPLILTALDIPPSAWPLFRVLVVALGVEVFVANTVLLLLYLDLRGSVLVVSVVFLLANALLTQLTIVLGEAWYGYGFLGASVVALLAAFALLVNRFRKLDYLTFTRQPMLQ